jgi:hypothetical protein
MPMDDLDAWLAAMPVQDVDRRIRELEGELEVLRTLKRQHAERHHRSRRDVVAESSAIRDVLKGTDRAKTRSRRLSPERVAIIRLISEHPEGMSPANVTRALQESGMQTEQNPVQTTMSRMAQAGQLLRVEHGRYRLPPETSAASLLNGSAAGEEG